MWDTDAEFASSIEESDVFKNKRISSFLEHSDRFLIVASKGMGKTLLLRLKRKLIEETEHGVLTVPRNKSADYIKLPRNIGKGLKETMRDTGFWLDIWQLAISVSMLLHFRHSLTPDEIDYSERELKRIKLPEFLREDIASALRDDFREYRSPSSILDSLLQEDKSILERIRSTSLQILQDLTEKHITSSVVLFIDSFDQALAEVFPDDLDIWCAAQNGLMKAAWQTSRHNRHIKVYATFRQEAYSAFDGAEQINMRRNVLLIEYTKSDLKAIFENAVREYEDGISIEEFVGFSKTYNGYLRIQEDVFEYIYRHTIGVPRWLITLGSAISDGRDDRGVVTEKSAIAMLRRQLADLVNRISAEELAIAYLENEMRPFFRDLSPQDYLTTLFHHIHSSVLSLSNIQRIATKFEEEWGASKLTHPFCLLYNLGLLGYVDISAGDTNKHQIFKKPYQFDWNYENILPVNTDTYYLLHPSLHHFAQRRNPRFSFNKVRIGAGLPWGIKERRRVEREKIKIFISYSHKDEDVVLTIADGIEDYLNAKTKIHDIWLDQWKMRAGGWISDQLHLGLEESNFLILAVSQNSLGSKAVAVEWKKKFSEKIKSGKDTVFPFLIDDTRFEDLPGFLSEIFSYSYDGKIENIRRLVDDILFWKTEQDGAGNGDKRRA